MKKFMLHTLLLSIAACLLIACGGATKPAPSTPIPTTPATSIACHTPRPTICTQQYDPVCGTSFAQPVCAPGRVCPTVLFAKTKTFSNSCSACSDTNIKSYTAGQCS